MFMDSLNNFINKICVIILITYYKLYWFYVNMINNMYIHMNKIINMTNTFFDEYFITTMTIIILLKFYKTILSL